MTLNKRTLAIGIASVAAILIVAFAFVAVRNADSSSDPAVAGQPQTLSIAHAQGETQVPSSPQTIVVFDMASLDTLDSWGVAAAGAPTGRYPDYLSRYAGDAVPRVGTLFEPDYEAVNALKPDLIIVAGRSAAKYTDLARIAPTIDLTIDATDYVGSSLRNIATLGLIFGQEDRAARDIAEIQSDMATLKGKAAGAGDALIVLTTGGRMSAYGPGSRFGVLYSEFGFVPARENLNTSNHGEGVNAEFVLQTDPRWLMVIDRDAARAQTAQGQGAAASAREVLNNDLIARTQAARNDRIVYLDPLSWYIVGGGVRSLKTMIDQLDQAVSAAAPQAQAQAQAGAAPAA